MQKPETVGPVPKKQLKETTREALLSTEKEEVVFDQKEVETTKRNYKSESSCTILQHVPRNAPI